MLIALSILISYVTSSCKGCSSANVFVLKEKRLGDLEEWTMCVIKDIEAVSRVIIINLDLVKRFAANGEGTNHPKKFLIFKTPSDS